MADARQARRLPGRIDTARMAAWQRQRCIDQLTARALNQLARRDPVERDAELRAGEMIRVLTDDLGPSVDEVVAVCDSRVDAREVRWLRRLARERSGSSS